jgi:hypothetical protein
MTGCWDWASTGLTAGHPWDCGITWRALRTVDPDGLAVDLAYIRDQVLRAVNGTAEDEHIEELIAEATDIGERMTQMSFMPQTRQLILTPGFPTDVIELPYPPLLEVVSIEYVDSDGVIQTMLGSPAEFQTIPSGDSAPGRVTPLVGESWPSARSQFDAVTITYTAGYASADKVPARYKAGIARVVSELYRNRELSMSDRQIEGMLKLDSLFTRNW